MKSRLVTTKLDINGRKSLKRMALELNTTVTKLSRNLEDYEKGIIELMKRGGLK